MVAVYRYTEEYSNVQVLPHFCIDFKATKPAEFLTMYMLCTS